MGKRRAGYSSTACRFSARAVGGSLRKVLCRCVVMAPPNRVGIIPYPVVAQVINGGSHSDQQQFSPAAHCGDRGSSKSLLTLVDSASCECASSRTYVRPFAKVARSENHFGPLLP